MKLPYNCLHAHGNVIFASRGGRIHSFKADDKTHLSTWTHPDVKAASEAAKSSEVVSQQPVAAQAEDDDQPPAKRQRTSDDGQDEPVPSETQAQRSGTNGKENKKGDNKGRMGRVPDRPVVIQLTSTEDGKHIVAVTGHDKAVWVFAHDGNGKLEELSKRIMPKRPSSIVTAPGDNILIADKFGDVYQLPLIPADDYVPQTSSIDALSKQHFTQPAATTLTVHSKGNRQALLNQQRQIEQGGADDSQRVEGPAFEHTLLLGHVSMLTAVKVGVKGDRKYIITSDRDEHIRVSRFIPQAHIIESYCLGHKQFVNDVVIPESQPDVLVSGGGDEELYVWDWEKGTLLSTVSVLTAAKAIAQDTEVVAVSKVCSVLYPTEAGPATYILAICEGINGVFSWQLSEEKELKCPGIIQLPGKPLDLIIMPGNQPAISVALHTAEGSVAKSVHEFKLAINDERLCVESETVLQDSNLDIPELEASEAEIRNLFYGVEQLRKQSGSGEEPEGEKPAESS